jgi:PST family polysaccharide transporter
VTGFTITDQITRSADRLAVGYFFGPGPLGFFQNALLLYGNAISILSESMHNVAISALSKLKDDRAALLKAWATGLSLMSFISAPLFAVISVTGEDVVPLLLGEKWAPAGFLLTIFGFRGIAHGAERSLGWLHVVAGRSDRWARWGLISAACHLVALAAGLPFGVTGVAVAYAAVIFVLLVPALVYAGSPFGIEVKDVLAAVGPQVASAVFATLVTIWIETTWLEDLTRLVRVVVSVSLCLTIYLAVIVLAFRVTQPIRIGIALVGDLTRRRQSRS